MYSRVLSISVCCACVGNHGTGFPSHVLYQLSYRGMYCMLTEALDVLCVARHIPELKVLTNSYVHDSWHLSVKKWLRKCGATKPSSAWLVNEGGNLTAKL